MTYALETFRYMSEYFPCYQGRRIYYIKLWIRCIPCTHDASIVVTYSPPEIDSLAQVVLELFRGVVTKVLGEIECPVTVIDGVAYALAKAAYRLLGLKI